MSDEEPGFEVEFEVGDDVIHYVPNVGLRARGRVCHVRVNHKTGRVCYDVLFTDNGGRLRGLLKEIPSQHVLPVPAVERLGDLTR